MVIAFETQTLYNIDPNSPTEMKLHELQARRENKYENIESTSFERGALGGVFAPLCELTFQF